MLVMFRWIYGAHCNNVDLFPVTSYGLLVLDIEAKTEQQQQHNTLTQAIIHRIFVVVLNYYYNDQKLSMLLFMSHLVSLRLNGTHT